MLSLRDVRTFESLALRDYRLLWLGQVGTSMGQWMDHVSRTWLVYDLTHSPLQLGMVSAARGIPMLLFGVIAGVAADRYGRKTQLIVAQTVNVFLNIILALLIITGNVQVWHIYVTGFLAGTVQAFQQPARQVLITDLVGERHLLNAVSLNSAAISMSRGIGPAVCGLLINAFGVGFSYFAQAALFALASVWTVQIKVPGSGEAVKAAFPKENQPFLRSAGAGIAHIFSHRLVLALMVLGLAPAVLGMPFIHLMPIFAVDVFNGGAGIQGFLLTMVGIGSVMGALATASFFRGQDRGKSMILAAIGFGLSLMAFSQSPVLLIGAVFALLAGFTHTSYTTQNQTALQLITPRELRGRVLGIYLLDKGLTPLGSLLAGALAALLGGPWAVTILGALCVLVAAGVGLIVPGLRNLKLAIE